MIKNIMTVDLEDHFCDLPFNMWKNYESRIVSTTKTILDLLRHFKSNRNISTAKIKDLKKIIGDKRALLIYNYYKSR